MDLAEILKRVEQRLKELGLTAKGASALAGRPDAIRNLKRAVRDGGRQGISTATIAALAPVLEVSEEWLATGRSGEPLALATTDNWPIDPMKLARLVSEARERLGALPEDEARNLTEALIEASRTRPNR